jgi:hypothetical protein
MLYIKDTELIEALVCDRFYQTTFDCLDYITVIK